jgi:hypothetical protein
VEPIKRQIFPKAWDDNRPEPVTLAELRPDASTGNYTATTPGTGYVDTKAQVAEIREANKSDVKRTAEAKQLISDNAEEIARMRATGGRAYKKWHRGYTASQKRPKTK